ncbi:capsule assembly Wzi family protein [uncultured Sunxiuqinia sp.]|uniref:capsule assembly Wzi family protein n=1 Tax=uncultured Sunxiuqinia sp. TaxID=1573825 RepID=UPI00260B439E|nr:capsule assembly Wzi family protein [uncultured Sunxiuqinia sp.]
MVQKIVTLVFPLFVSLGLLAQNTANKPALSLESRTLVSTGNQLPFWMQMNQLGMVDGSDAFQQLVVLHWLQQPQELDPEQWQFSYGLSVAGRLSEHAVLQPNEYWGRLHYKGWYLHAGAKGEPVFANGLSMTNGNMYLSNNARPMPRVGFGTTNFQLFRSGWLSRFAFDFEYNEYFLLDDRIVDDANLHHKRLDMNYTIAEGWRLSLGLDHWVFWGGTSPTHGELPGFEDYLRYVLGHTGSENAPETDQNNVAGNQLGNYAFSLTREAENSSVELYWQHPWEDGSGTRFENMPDGLWGVSWKQHQPHQLLEAMVIEYVNTRHQSGKYHKEPNPDKPGEVMGNGRDNYFNNSVYRSGFVSYDRMMGLPLFIPGFNADGVSSGFPNTRLWAVHQGMNGWLSEQIGWKTLATYSKHYGQHWAEYPRPKELLSLAAQVDYYLPTKPLAFSLKLAYDNGAVLDSGFGAELRVRFTLK